MATELTDIEPAVRNYPLRLEVDYPGDELSRGMLFVKWLLIIPHLFLLYFLQIGMLFATVVAWFAILITGRYPRSIFDFVVGVYGWTARTQAYSTLLVTDEYPPFSLGKPLGATGWLFTTLGVLAVGAFMAVWVVGMLAVLQAAGNAQIGPDPRIVPGR